MLQLLIAFLLFFCSSIEGGTIRAIIVGDTSATDLEEGILCDVEKMSHFLQSASFHCKLDYDDYVILNDAVTSTEIFSILDTLSIESDDVVLFYFSGHGYRTRAKKEWWPTLYLKNEQAGIDLGDVLSLIRSKQPRLTVVIADCCNNVVYLPDLLAPIRPFAMKRKMVLFNPYHDLFVNQKGEVIIAAARPGDVGLATNTGGIFTSSFLESMESLLVDQRPLRWDDLLIETTLLMVETTEHYGAKPQIPFYILELEMIKE